MFEWNFYHISTNFLHFGLIFIFFAVFEQKYQNLENSTKKCPPSPEV